MSARQRWLILAMIATAIAAFWPAREDDLDGVEVVQAMKPGAAVATPVGAAPQQSSKPESRPDTREERFPTMKPGNLFPRQTWVPPPPPPPKAKPLSLLPPPPPKPPPLPFSYLGRWQEAGSETLFLAQGERIHRVHQGEVLTGNWRLDEVAPDHLVFTYLPLEMTQTLRITP